MRRFTATRLIVALAAAAAITGGAYAFTAANTVPATNAGSGSGTVSGYTVSNIHYSLNTTTPNNATPSTNAARTSAPV